jgi:hypothetical protein
MDTNKHEIVEQVKDFPTLWLMLSITVMRAMWVVSGTSIAYSDRSDGRGACGASTLCVRQTLWEQGTSIALSERSDGAVGLLAAMVSDSDSVQSWHSVYQ